MNVSSILELYTTGFGWTMYGIMYSLLAVTGLLAYPFLLLVYESWRGGSESSNTMSMGSLGSLQTMKWGLIIKIFVFLMAVLPLSTVNLNQMKYEKSCDITGTAAAGPPVNRLNDDSTYKQINRTGAELVGVNAGATKIPYLWLLVSQISAGVTTFMTTNIPCIPDFTRLDNELKNLVINDAEVTKEYHQFVDQCYAVAKSRYSKATGGMPDAIINYAVANNVPESELIELDSEIFKNVPGFYDSIRALDPVPSVGYDPDRDKDFNQAQINAAQGQPWCKQWWTSLRDRLANAVFVNKPMRGAVGMQMWKVKDLYTAISTWTDPTTIVNDRITKYSIRAAVRAAPADFTGMYKSNDSNVAVNVARQAANDASGLSTTATIGAGIVALSASTLIPGVGDAIEGVASSFAGFYASLYIVQRAAPMVQAMILMLIYIFLPIYLVISKYEFEAVLQAAALIFTVKLFTLVFAVADYLDDSLYIAMFPDMNLLGSVATHGLDRVVLMVVIMSMYIFGPAFLLYLVTMAGANVRAGGAGASSTQSVGNAGGAAAGSATRGVTRAAQPMSIQQAQKNMKSFGK